MRIEDVQIGQWVIYRPHPDARAEDGEVTEVRSGGLVLVRYRGSITAKATRVMDLEPALPAGVDVDAEVRALDAITYSWDRDR